ncbi:DUF2157 domain-containing protein [Candidatus Parcubacteria bacterium]|nr:MAG: DUF2157 domain-containing protein [Candidatus Parcubacteria bacterium]
MLKQENIGKIKNSLAAGKSKEETYKELLASGESVDSITQAFAVLGLEGKREDSQRKIVKIIAIAGAILVAAGIFSFVAANWKGMSNTGKLSIILSSMIGSYLAGWILKEKFNEPRTGDAMIFLGALIYGAGIFLIGQMFHINVDWPDAFILWMLGLLALGYALDFYVIFYLSLIVGLVAVTGHPFIMSEDFHENRFIFTSPFLLALSAGVLFLSGFRFYRKIIAK